MGFVMWIDNQYMVAKPWGRFGWGLLEVPGEQWMEVRRLSIAGLNANSTYPGDPHG